MAVYAKIIKGEILENKKTAKMGLHRPMIMYGGKGKKLKKRGGVNDIEHQKKN